MKKTLLIVILAFVSAHLGATVYQTTGTNSWTPSNPNNLSGSSVGTTAVSDTFILNHSAIMKGMYLYGTIIIKDGGHLEPQWYFTAYAGSNIIVEEGGTLESKNLSFTNYSTNFEVSGTFDTKNGNFYNHGSLYIKSSGDWINKNCGLYNYSNITIDGIFDGQNSSFYNFSGALLTINNSFTIKGYGFYNYNGAEIEGYGYIDKDGNNVGITNNGTINGCTGSSCVTNDPIYLANFPISNDFEVYDDDSGTPSGTDCNSIVQVLKDLEISSDLTLGTLIVSPGYTVTVKEGVSITICDKVINVGTVELETSSSLVQTSATNQNEGDGVYKITRDGSFQLLKYNTWSSPIKSASLGEIFSDNNMCDIFTFKGTTQEWKYDYAVNYQAVCNGNPYTFTNADVIDDGDGIMDVARGYFATGGSGSGSSTRTFEGEVNNGTIETQVYTTNLGQNHNPNWTGDDWNLVGNPYPCAIDAKLSNPNSFINQNSSIISGDIYFWIDDNSSGSDYNQSSDYAIYNNMGGVSANGSIIPQGYIPSGQGFWVLATSTGKLEFNNDMRVSGNNSTFYKTEEDRPRFWFDLTNDANNFNQILIGFDDNATNDYDQGLDAPKAEGNSIIAFSSKIGSENYSIQALEPIADGQTKTIGLSIVTANPGSHTIELSHFENIEQFDVTLIDAWNGKSQDILTQPFITYLDTAGTYDNRFYLQIARKYDNTTSISEIENVDNISVWTTDNSIIVDAVDSPSPIVGFTIFNSVGKVMRSNSSLFTNRHEIETSGLNNGFYIISVEKENGSTYSEKFTLVR